MEQVQKCIAALEDSGFKEIVTLECLIREFQVRKIVQPSFDPDRPVPAILGQKRKAADEEDTGKVKEEPTKGDEKPDDITFYTGVPLTTMPGHTGYLTFATLSAKL